MESARRAPVLQAIEERFAFLTSTYGFVLAQSTESPAFAWYRSGARTVVVSYDPICDAAVDVHLEVKTTGERHLLADVLAFSQRLVRRTDVRGDALVFAEVERAATLVKETCAEFLSDDLDAFRRRYREALLVKTTRAAAMREFYDGDPSRSKALFEALRAYWTPLDREHVARLAAGGSDKSLAHLRLSR